MGDDRSANFNSFSLTGQHLPEGNHTLSGQMNGSNHQNHTNLLSGGNAFNDSAQHIKDEPMEPEAFSSMARQGPVKTIREEPPTHIKDEPMDPRAFGSMTKQDLVPVKTIKEPQIKEELKPCIKVEQKIPIKDNKQITVLIRGQGTTTKALQISRTASLDAFISEVNSLFGFGREPGNTYIVHNGKQLSRGTQTIEQAGIQDRSNVDLCVRTLGG